MGRGAGNPSNISSFQLSTGAVNWSYGTTNTFQSQAAYGNGLVVFTDGISGTNADKMTVLNASNGALMYTAPSTVNAEYFPLLVGESNGSTTAYVTDGGSLQALSLGNKSGSVLWTVKGEYGGESIPTLIGGNTIILAGPDQFYAINRATGAQNHFQAGTLEGGGGDTVVYDASRSELYIREQYNNSTPRLTAYHYGGSYDSIAQLWQDTGTGIGQSGEIALDANGDIYSTDKSNLVEIDPATGATLRDKTGQNFATSVTPLIEGDTLWAYNGSNNIAYDLGTVNIVATLPGSPGSSNTALDSPGAVDDSHYLLDYGDYLNNPGFDVYSAVPKPAHLALVATAIFALTTRTRRRKSI